MPGSASRHNRTDEFGGQKGSDCGPCRKEHSVKVACIGVGRATSHESLHHLKGGLEFRPTSFSLPANVVAIILPSCWELSTFMRSF